MTSLDKLSQLVENETNFIVNGTSSDVLLPEHFVRLTRGSYQIADKLSGKRCRVELWLPGTSQESKAAALFTSTGCGWFNNYEVAALVTKTSSLVWKRAGNEAEIKANEMKIGKMTLSWPLRLLYIGSGIIWLHGVPFCEFSLPVLGPSGNQRHDCTGRFRILPKGKWTNFVINPGESMSFQGRKQISIRDIRSHLSERDLPAFSQQPQTTHSIFDPSNLDLFSELSKEQRLCLLAVAVWPLSLYKLGTGG